MLLHKDKDNLEQAVRAAALNLSLPAEYIEKDYWYS